MRQLIALVEAIRKRNTTTEYYRCKFFAALNNAEMRPLEEILGVSSEQEESAFDDKTAAALEKRALEILEAKQRG